MSSEWRPYMETIFVRGQTELLQSRCGGVCGHLHTCTHTHTHTLPFLPMQRILTSRLKDIDLFAAGVSHTLSTRWEATERMAQQVLAGEREGRGAEGAIGRGGEGKVEKKGGRRGGEGRREERGEKRRGEEGRERGGEGE